VTGVSLIHLRGHRETDILPVNTDVTFLPLTPAQIDT